MSVTAGNVRLVLGLGMLAGACTTSPQAKPEEAAAAAKQAPPELVVTPEPVVTQEPVAKVEPVLPVIPAAPTSPEDPPVVAADGGVMPPVVAADGGVIPPVMPVAVLPPPVAAEGFEHVAPAWELVTRLGKEVEMQPLASGVLVRVAGVYHEVGPDGALVEKPTVEPPEVRRGRHEPVEGQWPDDAWRVKEVQRERTGSDLSFLKWRAGKRWVAQSGDSVLTEYSGDEFAGYRWSPRSGYLLAHKYDDEVSFMRLAGKHPAPAAMEAGAGYVNDVFESTGGTLFVFMQPDASGLDGRVEVLRSCKQGEPHGCERSGGLVLPVPAGEDNDIKLGLMAARDRWSISVAFTAKLGPRETASEDHYLLHYETGSWKLEAVAGDMAVRRMLAAPDGGLWVVLDDGTRRSLWHRSTAGVWIVVDLPAELAGSATLQVAMHQDRLWAVGEVGEGHAIHATPVVLSVPGSPAQAG